MDEIQKVILKWFIGVLPSLILVFVLLKLFPYTGLGRIVAIPLIVFLNLIIIPAGMYAASVLNQRRASALIFPGAVLLTLTIVVIGYPQEYAPPVTKQVWQAFKALMDYEGIFKEQLDLRTASRTEIAAKDRYVVALYKYRQEIPTDGTYHIYEEESSYFRDTTIRSIEDIPGKLIGHHKVMWWVLSLVKK